MSALVWDYAGLSEEYGTMTTMADDYERHYGRVEWDEEYDLRDAIEPDCADGLKHAWTSAGEGGCRENPGVWSLGGTTFLFRARCRYCGTKRAIVERGIQRNPGERDTVRYEQGERNEAAIADALRRNHRNRLARLRRERAAVSRYGSIEAWRGALREARATTLRANIAHWREVQS